MKKAAQFLLMLAVAICICIAAPEVYAAEGTCGTNVLWTLDEDTGAMTISGSGAITSYTGWKSYRAQIKTLTVEDGVSAVCDYAFHNCENLTDAKLADSVTSIGDYAFYNCDRLRDLQLPAVCELDAGAFYSCSALTEVTLPKASVINEEVFAACSALQKVTIPEGYVSISDGAFAYCESLSEITIPESVQDLEMFAFHRCSNLTRIHVLGDLETLTDDDGGATLTQLVGIYFYGNAPASIITIILQTPL